MANWQFSAAFIVPTLILLTGVVNDIYSRKVKNQVVVISAVLAIANSVYFGGTPQVLDGLGGFGMAFALMLPLVLLKILGAGDMKILMAFGLSVNSTAVGTVVLTSLLWGALLGLVRAVIQGDGLVIVKNTVGVFYPAWRVPSQTLHRIPYTVALLFGWFTYLSLSFHGRSL